MRHTLQKRVFEMVKKRTITLTNMPPVSINEESWPLIASASGHDYDGQYNYQSNRDSKWFVGVRQHADGRAIVSATYRFDSKFASERDLAVKRGILLPAATGFDEIVEAIREVAGDIASAEHNSDDARRWETLADDCIADLPAVELE